MSKSNEYELEKVPQDMKRGWIAMFSILMAVGVDLSSVLLGAELASGMSMKNGILSVIVGSFFMAILYTICAVVGSSTSLSVSMITKNVFGEQGAKVFSIVIALSLLGWFGVQVGFFAENAQIIIKEITGISVSMPLLSLIGGLLMMSTAIVGYKAMEKLSVYSVPFLVILIGITLFLAIGKYGINPIETETGNMSFAAGVSLSMSIGIVGAIISPNISRWAKSNKDCVMASFFGMLIGNSFMIIISIVLIKIMGIADIMKMFIVLGLGIPGIIVLTLAQWTTNTGNIYSSSLSMSIILRNIPIKKISFTLGIMATMLAVFGIYNQFVGFLNLLGIIIAPVGGIYTSEFYVIKEKFTNSNEYNQKTNLSAICAWIIGIIITYMATPSPKGLGIISITSIAPLDGFMTGFVSYAILSKSRSFINEKYLNKVVD